MGRSLPQYHIRLYWPESRPDGSAWWLVTFEELPGCMVQGQSMSEAEARLWRILPGYLKEIRRAGQPVPKPLETPAPSIEGISVVMVPGGVQGRPFDPGMTAPMAAIGELRSAAARADASLLGS
ncbi:MAG TPA: type II toxin-antitoxin system HicB family antitoxin [Gemmatimonadales bacterium]|nr:type II toxin-antitoxin system HicB family antitoxin [Gemmatimonadales bacterium]